MKADLAIYTHVLGVPEQYESVALMLSHKMDFNCCTNRDGFRRDSHILCINKCIHSFTYSYNANHSRWKTFAALVDLATYGSY